MTPPHPARWTPSILTEIQGVLERHLEDVIGGPSILDPFAGVDLDRLSSTAPGAIFYGIEIEPEWACATANCDVGDARHLAWGGSTFDALVTSPCYGNRMADSHEAKDASSRITYRHKLGRMPTEGSAGVLQWGQAYRTFHEQAWAEALRVLKSRALVVVNISNHIRDDVEQRVTEWHLNSWLQLGATIEEVIKIDTPRMGFGANGDKRTDGERLLVLRAPIKPRGSML